MLAKVNGIGLKRILAFSCPVSMKSINLDSISLLLCRNRGCVVDSSYNYITLILILAPLLLLPIPLGGKMAYCLILMATYWVMVSCLFILLPFTRGTKN